jgi:integrase
MLTDTQIRQLKGTGKAQRFWDERGLYIEVTPPGGKEKRIGLGRYPDVGLKDARERREEARKLVANGVDPSQHRKAQKASALTSEANSFETTAREWFIRYQPTWAESHSKTVIRRLEKDIFPWLGDRAISEITAPELLAVLRNVEGRGALETAHREMTICGQVFRYAVATGRAERDITYDLRGALPPPQIVHHAAVTDPKRLGEILRILDSYQGGLVVRCALRLAPLIFVRPGELRRARWSEVDFENAEWRYVASKTKTEHIVPLSKQAIEVLREIQPLTGRSEWVFTNGRSISRPMSENAVLAALRALGIDKNEMTGHGFRASARTLLDEVLGFRIEIIEQQLAHAVRDAHGRAYNRTKHLDERRVMMQAWADYLDKLSKSVVSD